MKIRILKQGKGTLTEEIHHVTEIIETSEKFLLKRFLDDKIIEILKSEIFYHDVSGFFLKN